MEDTEKDLKRKKTMNIILLLFVVLCSMFAAASVNNIIAVVGGLDYYFEKAELGDYFIIERSTSGEDTISKILKHSENVSGYRTYNVVNASCDDLKTDSGKLMEFSNIALICDINNTKQNFFGMDNEVITDVEKGKVYITGSVPKREGVKIGERFYVELGDTKLPLEVAGFAKDALLGSEMMGNPDFLSTVRTLKHSRLMKLYILTVAVMFTTSTPTMRRLLNRSLTNRMECCFPATVTL